MATKALNVASVNGKYIKVSFSGNDFVYLAFESLIQKFYKLICIKFWNSLCHSAWLKPTEFFFDKGELPINPNPLFREGLLFTQNSSEQWKICSQRPFNVLQTSTFSLALCRSIDLGMDWGHKRK